MHLTDATHEPTRLQGVDVGFILAMLEPWGQHGRVRVEHWLPEGAVSVLLT